MLEKTVDTFVLDFVSSAKAGHRVGTDRVWVGSATEYCTVTSAAAVLVLARHVTNPLYTGFHATMVGKGLEVDLASGVTQWFLITAVTDSLNATVSRWDGTVPAITYGGSGYGAVAEAAVPTTMTKTNIYQHICDLATKLDEDEIPDSDRHMAITPAEKNLLVQATQLQPDIAMYHEEVVINGKVGRVAGFDMHMAAGSRVRQSTGARYPGGGSTGTVGYNILACHKSFITFASKWAETRVVDDIDQFAKLYQGLFLYGAVVAVERRKAGALLFTTN